jgi:DNA end-binding protein Ku
MATTVWRGQLTFALVSFPVRLFRAARAEKVRFRRLHRETAAPSSSRRHTPTIVPTRNLIVPERTAGTPPPPADAPVAFTPADSPSLNLVRGYEVEKDQFVVIEDEEFRALPPETSKDMQIVEFVRLDEVDPIYFETSYYVKPDEPGERPYALLLEAMRKSGFVALAELAMHRREHVVILRPGRTGLIAHTMFYQDEVRSEQEYRAETAGLHKKELDLARRLIETMVVPFEPGKYVDKYRQKLEDLIASRKPVGSPKKPVQPAMDILAALQESLAAARRAG